MKYIQFHPYLGQKKKQVEVGKHLPETRLDINDWASVVPEETLAALRKAGYFLDLWHWRAHRSNPIGASDDQFVFDCFELCLDAIRAYSNGEVEDYFLDFRVPGVIGDKVWLDEDGDGILGKKLEPLIAPMGFDWKIGIALVTSFAAREVFVGTMATLYSVEESDNSSLREKLKAAVRPDGTPVYSLAAALSLMVFYVLAMQCMSTLAVVKRETQSWKWPTIQFFMMTGLAYLMSWAVYVIAK
mgnify:CR=1 FL=1